MIRDLVVEVIKLALGKLELPAADIRLDYSDTFRHGDYTTNVALALGRERGESPAVLAEKIKQEILKVLPLESPKARPWLARVEVAGPGFLNFWLTPEFLRGQIFDFEQKGIPAPSGALAGQRVLIEYTDPNPFKEFHIGHLMSNTIGEAISRLIGAQGAEVRRACYQGDVGLHVAKAIWGLKKLKAESEKSKVEKKVEELGQAYAAGAKAYEESEIVKTEINLINKKVYDRSDEEINKIYDSGRRVSLDYFETIYRQLGTKFDYYFFESEMAPIGEKLTRDNLGKVFAESQGAIIFPGEKYGLHTRVFINSDGLPTYEAKELGLAKVKYDKYPYDLSLIITGNEINEYFKVLLAALQLIFPDLAIKTKHLPHGMLRLPEGKMSSRSGQVITAESLLDSLTEMAEQKMKDRDWLVKEKKDIARQVAIGALKYSILRQAPGRDTIFDFQKSLSLEGDSGPYLQYTLVRARSVLIKAGAPAAPEKISWPDEPANDLERLIFHYPEILTAAADHFAPHRLVTYLTVLAGAFNSYYSTQQIIGSDAVASYRLALTRATAIVLEHGLGILAIPLPDKM